jgi:hypothetical protein
MAPKGKSLMLRSILFLIFTLLLSQSPQPQACAQDFFSGKIMEVNEKTVEILLAGVETEGVSIKEEQRYTIRIAHDNVFPKHNDKTVFPECVKPGNWIKIWGHLEEQQHHVIVAYDIKGCLEGGCSDPTGIMSRLRKIMESKNSFSGKGNQEHGSGGNEGNGGGGGGGGGGAGGGGHGGGRGGGGGGKK